MIRRLLPILLLVLLGTLGLPAVAQDAPPPGLGIRLLEAPTARKDDPRARSYIVDRVRPGQSFTRRIEVSNGDREPMDVVLYATSGSIADGEFAIGASGATGAVAEWFSVEPETLRLAPGARAEVVVRVQVPRDAPDGEQYGGVVVERPPGSGATGIRSGLRAAIRVYLSVGAGAEPASDFTIEALTAKREATGEPVVEARVVNTGGRALDLNGELRLTQGPGGLSAGPFQVLVPTTLGIGQSGPVGVTLDEALPAGPWRAEVRLRSGATARGATATISFPDAAGGESQPVRAEELSLREDPDFVIPIAVGIFGLAVLLLLFALVRRRSKDEDDEQQVAL